MHTYLIFERQAYQLVSMNQYQLGSDFSEDIRLPLPTSVRLVVEADRVVLAERRTRLDAMKFH